jgi:hypothetical protein
MMKKAFTVVLSLLILLTAAGCVPKEDPVETEGIRDTQAVTVPQTSEPEATETAAADEEEERDFPERTHPNIPIEFENAEPDATTENTETTDAEQIEPAASQPQKTEGENADQEPSLEENETEIDR